MLRFLKIQNLAVIDQAELEVGPGFICLTGESGSGKSVLIDALLLLSGERASTDLVRTGCNKAIVEAEFEVETDHHHEALELLDDQTLYLRREVTKDGKSRAFVNGVLVPKNILQRYGELAFEIHGQHGQQRLLKEKFHLPIFEDQTGLKDQSMAFEQASRTFKAHLKTYFELKNSEAQRLKEIDFTALQIKEIKEVCPCEKDLNLEKQLKKARNVELIRAANYELSELIGGRIRSDLNQALTQIDTLLEFHENLKPYQEQITSLVATMDELYNEIAYSSDSFEDQNLQNLEQRESELNRLFMKYGRDIPEVLAEYKQLQQKHKDLTHMSEGLEQRKKDLETEYNNLLQAKALLHKNRNKAIGGFASKVKAVLQELNLKNADFQIENEWAPWPDSAIETRELTAPTFRFLFSSNLGEPVKPLSKVASGGELSRVLLALIHAFKRTHRRLLIFDEIDSGLGGETAHSVGTNLARLGNKHQVLCVTHFAQVARFANTQIKVQKTTREGRTFTSLVVCDTDQRITELARLLGGDTHSQSLREHAASLLS